MASSVRISQLPESGNLADSDYLLVEKTDRTTKTSIGYMITNLKLAKLTDYSVNAGAGLIGTTAGTTVQAAITALQSADKTLTDSLSALATRVKTNETDISTLKASTSSTSSSLSNLMSRVDSVESSVTTLSDASVQQQSDIVNIKSNVSDLTSKTDTTNSDVAAAVVRISTLESGLSTANGNISTVTDNVTAIQDRLVEVGELVEYKITDTEGFQIYKSGAMTAWGRVVPTSGLTDVTFSREFSTAPVDIQLTPETTSDTTNLTAVSLVTDSVTTTGFSVRTLAFGGSSVAESTSPFRWKAAYTPTGTLVPTT